MFGLNISRDGAAALLAVSLVMAAVQPVRAQESLTVPSLTVPSLTVPSLTVPSLTVPKAATAAAQSDAPSPKVLTGKERLGPKWTDEQRTDNCRVPVDKRGAKPRPDTCPDGSE